MISPTERRCLFNLCIAHVVGMSQPQNQLSSSFVSLAEQHWILSKTQASQWEKGKEMAMVAVKKLKFRTPRRIVVDLVGDQRAFQLLLRAITPYGENDRVGRNHQ